MGAMNGKRSAMAFFSDSVDVYSHQVRIVLAEKCVTVDIIPVDLNNPPEDFIDLNPYGTLPTLVDRDLVVYEAPVIMEYLDERFPHPPLMPVYPVARARSRIMMHRIESDWYTLMRVIEEGGENADNARKELAEGILAVAPIFAESPFFLSEEFSLVDCCLAPLLWRLPKLGVELQGQGAREVQQYAQRLFNCDSFKVSLTEAEKEMREPGQ